MLFFLTFYLSYNSKRIIKETTFKIVKETTFKNIKQSYQPQS